jgi:hypothetical protein
MLSGLLADYFLLDIPYFILCTHQDSNSQNDTS